MAQDLRGVETRASVEFPAADGCEAWAIRSDLKITDEIAHPGQAVRTVGMTPE